MATPSQPDPTTHLANYSISEPIENSTPTPTTISSAESLPSHSPPLVESCLPVMTITTVMSGIHSRARGLVSCLDTIIESVPWESVGMVSPSAPEVGTVYSRSVFSCRSDGTYADVPDLVIVLDTPHGRPSRPFSPLAYNAFLEIVIPFSRSFIVSIMSFCLIDHYP